MKIGIIGAGPIGAILIRKYTLAGHDVKMANADLNLAQLKKSIANATREILPERREFSVQFIIKQDPEKWMVWWKDCTANNRNIFESDLTA